MMDYDKELISDFFGEYSDAQFEVEPILEQWNNSPKNENLNTLFRVIHSIKSNFCMMRLNPLAEVIHILEDILSQIRDNQRELIPGFTLLISVVLEQCKELSREIFNGSDKSNEIENLSQILIRFHQSSEDQYSSLLLHTLRKMDQHGYYGRDYSCQPLIAFLNLQEENFNNTSLPISTNKDLEFFNTLILQIENHFPFWKNRSKRILKLVSKMNELSGYPVNPEQLEAAVYTHDIGMSFLPPQKIYIAKDLDEEGRQMLQSHCDIGFQWLNLVPGWEQAATMVLQHHERYDGKGYPAGIAENKIDQGAKLLAIGDTYASITGHEKKGSQSKPIMFAITEINIGSGHQFDPQWVEVFNHVIRNLKT